MLDLTMRQWGPAHGRPGKGQLAANACTEPSPRRDGARRRLQTAGDSGRCLEPLTVFEARAACDPALGKKGYQPAFTPSAVGGLARRVLTSVPMSNPLPACSRDVNVAPETTGTSERTGGCAQVMPLPRASTSRPGVASLAVRPVQRGGLWAWSAQMKSVFRRLERVAPTDLPVLVEGPTGTGKELIAQEIHDGSARHRAPFVALNCGALTEGLIESELFGHVKGAFTGATVDKRGAFEACDGGTLFLDEIGELPLALQPRLLRVLETLTVRRVGAVREVPVDVRIVAATHRDLVALVQQGRFRQDLLHRLVVLTVRVGPLAERPDDVLGLARLFCERPLTRRAEAKLLRHEWPGNVRELKNAMVRAAVMTDGPTIDAEDIELLAPRRSDLPVSSLAPEGRGSVAEVELADGDGLRVDPEVQRRRYIRLLRECRNNRAEAARRLGVPKSTFHAQLRRLGIPLKFGPVRTG